MVSARNCRKPFSATRSSQVEAWLLRRPGAEPNSARVSMRCGCCMARCWPT
ncbi:Uncharacterised protein [Bordetella pertussis]|nr:Uncharacterised protein [Bordetella pertussis]